MDATENLGRTAIVGAQLPARWTPSGPARPLSGRLLIRLLIGAALLAPFVWVGLARVSAVADGTLTYPSAPDWSARGVSVSEVLPGSGGLRVGDCVTAVDGVPILDLATGTRRLPAGRTAVGQVLDYQVTRPVDEPGRLACTGYRLTVQVPLRDYPLEAAVRRHASGLPLVLTVFLVASFVLAHRPGDPAARALFAAACFAPLGITAWPLGNQVVDLVDGPRLWPFVLGELANTLAWGALLHFVLVFPQRHPRLPRGRRAARVVVAGAYAFPLALHLVVLGVTLPGTTDALQRLGMVTAADRPSGVVVPPLLLLGLAAGYRATREPAARLRMRWLLALFAVSATLYLGLSQVPAWLLGHPFVGTDWNPVLFLPFPLALGAAVLRYSLFDIDVIVRRSLVYVVVTAVGAAVYLACVVLLTRFFGQGSSVPAILAAGLVVLGGQPMLDRMRSRLSRVIFGARDDPGEVLHRLSTRLGEGVALDAVLPSIVETLGSTLRLGHAAVELSLPDGRVDRVTYGTPTSEGLRVPLHHQGEQIGRLVLEAAPGREPFGAADRHLIDTLVGQVSVTAYNVLLQRRLQRSLERVVAAREEERRRLRRDIHDGVGPTLAAGTLRLEVAKSLVTRDPARADQLLDGVIALQHTLTRDIRGLVEGLRPPVLDQLGLVSAVRQQAASLNTGSGLWTVVDAPASLVLPAAVEVAAYRIVTEALANVVRHARAGAARVRLSHVAGAADLPGTLLVEVIDDGVGLPAQYTAGVGLSSMRERALEIGGTCTVSPGPDGGTSVVARLPTYEGSDGGTDGGTGARWYGGRYGEAADPA